MRSRQSLPPDMGRAVIAMTAVRIGAHVEPGRVTDLSDLRPPTDVMAITSLPQVPAIYPVSGFPLSVIPPRPATRGCHPPPENGSHFCTFAQAAGRFALLHLGQHVVLSLPQNSPNPNCSARARQSFTGRRPLEGVGSARQAAAQQTASLRRSWTSRPSWSP